MCQVSKAKSFTQAYWAQGHTWQIHHIDISLREDCLFWFILLNWNDSNSTSERSSAFFVTFVKITGFFSLNSSLWGHLGGPVECLTLDFTSGLDLMIPALGATLNRESAWGSLLPLPLSPPCQIINKLVFKNSSLCMTIKHLEVCSTKKTLLSLRAYYKRH